MRVLLSPGDSTASSSGCKRAEVIARPYFLLTMQVTKYIHGLPVSCQMSVPGSFGVPDSDLVGVPDSIIFLSLMRVSKGYTWIA